MKFSMGILGRILIVSLIVGWAIGFFVFHLGREIHMLLLMAMTALSVAINEKDSYVNK